MQLTERPMVQRHSSCEPLDLPAKAADLLDRGPLVAVGWEARMTETIEKPDPGYRYELREE